MKSKRSGSYDSCFNVSYNTLVRYLIYVILITCTYLAITKMPIFSDTFAKLFSVLKDLSLFAILIIWALIALKRKKLYITFDKLVMTTLLYLLMLGVYTAISPVGFFAILGFAAMASPLILFLVIYSSNISNEFIYKILGFVYYFLLFNVITGLLIFLFCPDFFNDFFGVFTYFEDTEIGIGNIYRATANGDSLPRLLGLSVSPNETASVCIFLLIFSRLHIKNTVLLVAVYILLLLTIYFTYARSPFIGFLLACGLTFYLEKNRLFKLLTFLPMIAFLAMLCGLLYVNINKIIEMLDISSLIHLYQLLIEGPKYIAQYWYGLGVGMAGALMLRMNNSVLGTEMLYFESDHYNLILQVGIIGFILFLLVYYNIYMKLHRIIKTCNNRYINDFASYNQLFILTMLIGSLTFPLISSSRLIGTILLIYPALVIKLNSNYSNSM